MISQTARSGLTTTKDARLISAKKISPLSRSTPRGQEERKEGRMIGKGGATQSAPPHPHPPTSFATSPSRPLVLALSSSFRNPSWLPHKPPLPVLPHPLDALPHIHPSSPTRSPEARGAAAHDLALADELGVELAAVEGEVDVEVDAVEGALRGVHALEVLLEVLAREVGRQGDDFLDACREPSVTFHTPGKKKDAPRSSQIRRKRKRERKEKLTRILRVLRTHILVARVQDILVHQRRPRRHLAEEGDLDRLADLDALALLHEDLARVLAAVLAVQARHPVLLRVVALLERLQRRHQVVPARDPRRHHPLRDARCDGTFDDRGDGVHRPNDLGLELRRDVQLDLLEEVLRGAEAADDEDVLGGGVVSSVMG